MSLDLKLHKKRENSMNYYFFIDKKLHYFSEIKTPTEEEKNTVDIKNRDIKFQITQIISTSRMKSGSRVKIYSIK
jgi:hypothetical protein